MNCLNWHSAVPDVFVFYAAKRLNDPDSQPVHIS